MAKFKVTLFFNIPLRSSRLVSATEVRLLPPAAGRIKVNIDGSSFGPVPSGAIGGVFRNDESLLGGFTQNTGCASAQEAELCAAMFAIEKAAELNRK